MPMFPKITVITPVLNGASVIRKAIESVVKQDYPNFEYIILDAFSTDGTAEIVREYGKKITFIQQKDNGPTDAYNFAIKQTDGEIIAMLSADDWLEPGILNDVGQVFCANPHVEIVSTCTKLVKETGPDRFETVREFAYDDLHFNFQAVLDWPLTNARFYRKKLFENYGYFTPRDKHDRYNIPSDTGLLLNFALHPINHVRLNKLGYTFLCHENSLTTSTDLAKKNHISRQLLEIYEELLTRSSLSKEQRKLLRKYHARELVSIIFRSVRIGDIKSFLNAYSGGVAMHKLSFLQHLSANFMRLAFNKVKK